MVLWLGGVPNLARVSSFRNGEPNTGLVLLMVVGLVLLAAATLTVLISSAGVLLVGGAQLVATLIVSLGVEPIIRLFGTAFGADPVLGAGLAYALPTGVCAITGVTLLAVGLAARRRAPGHSTAGRVLSVVVGVLLGLGGIALALAGGSTFYTNYFQFFSLAFPVLAFVLLVVGVVLVGIAVYCTRWSSAGAIVIGAGVLVLGLASVWQPVVFDVFGRISPDFGTGVRLASGSGNIALIGVVILAAGVGAKLRAVRVEATRPTRDPASV